MNLKQLQKRISNLYANPKKTLNDYLVCHKIKMDLSEQLPEYFRKIKIAFLSSFTIKGLPEVIEVQGVFHNLWIDSYGAPYNRFTQEILDEKSPLYEFNPDLIYLILDAPDILSDVHLVSLLDKLNSQTKAKIAVFDFFNDKKLNKTLESYKSKLLVFNFSDFINKIGTEEYWYTKYMQLGDLRLSPQAFPLLAEKIMFYPMAVSGAMKKCLVVDLDNTLWTGIVGEDGWENIIPNRHIQEYILDLYKQGVVIAINSKNNLSDALEAIDKNPRMVLKKNNFAAWRINWQDKNINMLELARELNLGVDSFVFIDDDPFQQNLIRETLPEIAVVPIETIREYAGFSTFNLTEEDRRRGEMYIQERARENLKSSMSNPEDFLKQLKLEVIVEDLGQENISRVSQLTQKTNQFNLTTRRYTEEKLIEMQSEGFKIWFLKVKDVFGDYGLTAVAIIKPEVDCWVLDSFLLSCRVLGRGIEDVFMNFLTVEAAQKGISKIRGEFIVTNKNSPCQNFLNKMGFNFISKMAQSDFYEYNVKDREINCRDFIKLTYNKNEKSI